MGLARRSGGAPSRLKALKTLTAFLRREKFLTLLLLIYFALIPISKGRVINLKKYVDWSSIFMIVSLLFVSRGLELSGAFARISEKFIDISKGSGLRLTILVILTSALSAMVLMNDASLFVYVPIILTISKISEINVPLFLTLVSISANIGSALTPIGNPQNIIIWQHYGVSFLDFIKGLAPFFIISFVLLLLYSLLLVGKGKASLKVLRPPRLFMDKKLFITSLSLLILDVFLGEKRLSYLSLAITFATLTLVRREVVLEADYALIAIFILMFADFRGLSRVMASYGLVPNLSTKLSILYWGSLLSQVMSNVPATIFLLDYTKSWKALAIATNLGGVGLITGSLANIITLRLGKIKIREFHKYSLPYFITLLLLFTLIFLY